jgi:hypothetical protein
MPTPEDILKRAKTYRNNEKNVGFNQAGRECRKLSIFHDVDLKQADVDVKNENRGCQSCRYFMRCANHAGDRFAGILAQGRCRLR